MSRRKSTGPSKPSTKLRARVTRKSAAEPQVRPQLVEARVASPEPEAAEADRPTVPEIPEARRSAPTLLVPARQVAQEAPNARTSAQSPPAEDHATDDLSLSASFFASEPLHAEARYADSLAPTSARSPELAFDDELDAPEPPSPQLVARRARLRRAVGGALGAFAAAMLALVAIRPLVAPPERPAVQAPTGYAADLRLAAEPAAPEPAKVEPAAPEPAKAEPAPVAQEGEPPAALTQRSVRALERGKRDEAIELSTRAITADPTDAMPYLIQGSAFLEKGDMKAARAAFDACVTHAKKGAVYECAAMGGKKQR